MHENDFRFFGGRMYVFRYVTYVAYIYLLAVSLFAACDPLKSKVKANRAALSPL